MDKESMLILAERKERYCWEIGFMLMAFGNVLSTYGSATLISLVFGMATAKIIAIVVSLVALIWAIYRFIGYLKLFMIKEET